MTWPPWKKWVLDHLDADLLLCGGLYSDSEFTQFAKYIINPTEMCDLDAFDSLPGETFGKNAKPVAKILLSWRNELWKYIIGNKLDEKYDMFIISRSDIIWTGPHPILDCEHIWCINGGFHLGLCDRHMAVPRKFLEPVLTIAKIENLENTFKILNEKFREGVAHGYAHCLFNFESFMYCRFKERGLLEHIGLSPFPMYSILSDGTAGIPDELDGDQETITWPFTIIHNYLSPRGLFVGRAQK
jgi:hypothetical protein